MTSGQVRRPARRTVAWGGALVIALACSLPAVAATAGAQTPPGSARPPTTTVRRGDVPGVGQPVGQAPSSTAPAPSGPPTTSARTPSTITPAAPAERTTAVVDDGPPRALIGVLGLAVGVVLGALVGALVAAGLSRRRPATRAPVTGPVGPPGADPQLAAQAVEVARQRGALVTALVELRDQVSSDALRQQAGTALQSAGLRELRPDGERFDPQWHVAVDQEPTGDARLDHVIASTERPGYLDGAHVLRRPEVVVYRLDPARASGAPPGTAR